MTLLSRPSPVRLRAVLWTLGGLLVVYFLMATFNKRQGRRRKSRTFMDGQRLKDRRDLKKDRNPEPKP